MSQDPYSGYNANPENPYGAPNPYGTPSQPPHGVPPSQYPQQGPPQTPHGVPPSQYPQQGPPQMPYGGMPPQGPPYGVPGYDPNQGGYGYGASAPLPLSEAINQLPNQYIRVLTKPSAATFAAEMGKASWDIVWIQLIGLAVISAVLGYIRTYIPGAVWDYNAGGSASPISSAMVQTIVLSSASIASIIVVPLSFFIGQGITYLLARAFGGTGTFLRQGYAYLLFSVPLGIISSAAGLVPFLGGLVAFGLGIYGIVLQIFSLMAVHRLSGGKATAVVLIPIAILIVLVIIIAIIIAVVIAAAIRSSY